MNREIQTLRTPPMHNGSTRRREEKEVEKILQETVTENFLDF